MAKKIQELEALATNMVGDGRSPELYFVTDEGAVVMVSRWFRPAYDIWRYLSRQQPRRASALESRKIGLLASVGEDEEKPGKLVIRDDTEYMIKKGIIRG